MIYCDSRHSELETCCDIPSGPVSKDSCMETMGRNGNLAFGREGGVQGLEMVSRGSGGHLPSECDLRGSQVIITRVSFPGQPGYGLGEQGHVAPPKGLLQSQPD